MINEWHMYTLSLRITDRAKGPVHTYRSHNQACSTQTMLLYSTFSHTYFKTINVVLFGMAKDVLSG